MSRVLVLTTEPLPLPGTATTGAGLRAWGLAEGLRSAGMDVIIGTPIYGDDESPAPDPVVSHVRIFRRNAIAKLLDEVHPDVLVLQHWGMAAEVPELSIPLVLDLAGPHLLERKYWGSANPEHDLQEKLSAIRRADFITCSGYYQRHYFYPYLEMAGYDTARFPVPVIPFSVPPAASEKQPAAANLAGPTFVYGGAFLAWQDPTRAITWLLQEMDDVGRGRLLFYGGSHPVLDASAAKFTELVDMLSNHPRVDMRGWKPFDELLQEYRAEGHVALDLMTRNPERELAFTTRTMIYLHCGLPVIYNDYSEVSQLIHNAKAGWTLDPDDEHAFRTLAKRILSGKEALAELSVNAVQLSTEYDWTKTVTPLLDFCTMPKMREGRVEFALAHEMKLHDTLNASSSGRRITPMSLLVKYVRPGRLAAPFLYLATWPISLYIRLRLHASSRHS
ncbi:MAG: glycosyltransferase family 4 protein [Candidatus Sumerlaeaceae bacterium]